MTTKKTKTKTKKKKRLGRPARYAAPAESLTVRLSPKLREAIDRRARAAKCSLTEIVTAALERELGVTS